jgi:hypothetical protein
MFCGYDKHLDAGLWAEPGSAAKVEALLKQMTLAEKIGQISQINIFYLMKNGIYLAHPTGSSKNDDPRKM